MGAHVAFLSRTKLFLMMLVNGNGGRSIVVTGSKLCVCTLPSLLVIDSIPREVAKLWRNAKGVKNLY